MCVVYGLAGIIQTYMTIALFSASGLSRHTAGYITVCACWEGRESEVGKRERERSSIYIKKLRALPPRGIPDSFLVSGRVNHSGMIIGKNRMYVTRSRHVSGQDRSNGWFSSSSSAAACKLTGLV